MAPVAGKPALGGARLWLLLGLGTILICVGFVVRNSSWARERRLRVLSAEELSYAVHDEPNDALTWLYYGSALYKSGDAEHSEQAFRRAIQLDPKLVRAHDGLGAVLMATGKLQSANEAFQAAVKIDPKDAVGLLGVSQTFYQAGSALRAIEPLKTLVALDNKNAVAWYHLGRLYGEAHQPDLAYAAMQKAVTLNPKNADYWRDLALLSQHYGKLKESEGQLTRALQLAPDDAVAHFLLGKIYAQMGDTPAYSGRAEKELLSALQRDPKMAEAYFELGQLYERQKNYSLAITNLRKACELNTSDDRSLYHLGTCLLLAGNKKEGEATLKGARDLAAARKEITDLQNRSLADPQNRELHLRLARVWRKYENEDDAEKEYHSYAMLGPPDPVIMKEIEAYVKALRSRRSSAASGQSQPGGRQP